MISLRMSKRKVRFSLIIPMACVFLVSVQSAARAIQEPDPEVIQKCPEAFAPAPPVLDVDLVQLKSALSDLRDTEGREVWKNTAATDATLEDIFKSTPRKTKLEQFFQLLFVIQKNLEDQTKTVTVQPPKITDVLLAAKVFTDPAFPKRITSVELKPGDANRPPLYKVQFSEKEVRFPINQGKGFTTWDQGMCQIAKELVFYPGFSFRIRTARNSKNLVVDDFNKVEIFGQFGTRKVFSIDLNYIDLEKVEFIRGTDEGKVKARVAQREFEVNKHSKLFKFIGTMIPNTARQRIDW